MPAPRAWNELIVNPPDNPEVTVIIATAARPERAEALQRAIAGVNAQRPIPELLVVVNGAGFDKALVESLKSDPRVRYDYLNVGSYPAAQRRGRDLVRTAFFCYLDDDDELLPGSIAARLERAKQADQPDIVVCDGVRHVGERDIAFCDCRPVAGTDLMLDLLRQNWFASTAPLFRSDSIVPAFFDGKTKYFEWTLIAFRVLSAGRRMVLIDDLGFRLHDSPASLSKNPLGTLATPALLNQLLDFDPPRLVRDELRRRLAKAHHACSDLEHHNGNHLAAWRHHLRSIALPGGLAYLAYTRRLVLPPTLTGR